MVNGEGVNVKEIIACCGLACSACPAYVATQSGERDVLERVAAEWRELFGLPDITADDVACDGCLVRDGRLWVHCADCVVRICAMGRGVVNCGHCPDYACDKLEAVFDYIDSAQVPAEDAQDPRAVLDDIRRVTISTGR
jgi:hypothetical protein